MSFLGMLKGRAEHLDINEIAVKARKENDAVLLDVREDDEWALGRAAGARDDHANAAFSSFFCVIKHFVGHAVCTYDAGFKRHAEVFKHLCGVFHHFPVGSGTHHNPHQFLF